MRKFVFILLVVLMAACEGGRREPAEPRETLLQEVKALETIIGIDIMTSRDADAWEKALEAEAIARDKAFQEELAEYVGDVLIQRSRRIADIGLSQREIQIIRLSSEGLTVAQIAEKLYLSVHTVNTHRQRIYGKMDVKNVSDMLRVAKDLGII